MRNIWDVTEALPRTAENEAGRLGALVLEAEDALKRDRIAPALKALTAAVVVLADIVAQVAEPKGDV